MFFEKICLRIKRLIPFNSRQRYRSGLANLLKRDDIAGVFLLILPKFSEHQNISEQLPLTFKIPSRILLLEAVVRSCSVKKVFFKNFAKFTGKNLCKSFFFNKTAGLRPVTLLI